MIIWADFFYFFLYGAALLLSVLGVWLTAAMPGMEPWSRRFFLSYFGVLVISYVFALAELFLHYSHTSLLLISSVMFLETLFLSLTPPLMTVYLLHCCGESLRESRLLHVVLALFAAHLLLLVSDMFISDFYYITPDLAYYRGPLYPLLALPMTILTLLNSVGTLKRKNQLSRKVWLSFLVTSLPLTVTLLVHLFVDVFALIGLCIVLSALTMFILILSDNIEQDRRRQLELANQRASIMVLQMRPHFIYNTLMSIYSLCNQDPQKARQVTKDFTDYLRRNFNAIASDNPIPFSAELEHTRAYLAVEQAQHEEMLLVEYDTPFTRFRLPPLTLQPIVENAVKHGLNPAAGPLHVTVRSCHADHASVIVVEDNGPGFDTSKDSESHTTLANIRQRLELMCGGRMKLALREAGGTIVTVTIPDRNAEE